MTGPSGNYYDKFQSANPIEQRLMHNFKQSIVELEALTEYSSLLELGCGEGYIQQLLQHPQPVGLDIDYPIVKEAAQRYPAGHYLVGDGTQLPFRSNQFDLVLSIEVMEHVPNTDGFLEEVKRITTKFAIFSVPREPIWRMLNMSRGKYLSDFGNTPGHINHWSSQGFIALLSEHFKVVRVKRPLPWTMVLCSIK